MAVSPLSPPYSPKAACINYSMWGRVLDVINHAKLIGSGVSELQVAENRLEVSPLQQCTHQRATL